MKFEDIESGKAYRVIKKIDAYDDDFFPVGSVVYITRVGYKYFMLATNFLVEEHGVYSESNRFNLCIRKGYADCLEKIV